MRLWDVSTGNLIASLEDEQLGIQAIAFSPDGKKMVGSSQGGSLAVWNLRSRKLDQLLQPNDSIAVQTWLAQIDIRTQFELFQPSNCLTQQSY